MLVNRDSSAQIKSRQHKRLASKLNPYVGPESDVSPIADRREQTIEFRLPRDVHVATVTHSCDVRIFLNFIIVLNFMNFTLKALKFIMFVFQGLLQTASNDGV